MLLRSLVHYPYSICKSFVLFMTEKRHCLCAGVIHRIGSLQRPVIIHFIQVATEEAVVDPTSGSVLTGAGVVLVTVPTGSAGLEEYQGAGAEAGARVPVGDEQQQRRDDQVAAGLVAGARGDGRVLVPAPAPAPAPDQC